jgi:hypothetical protein
MSVGQGQKDLPNPAMALHHAAIFLSTWIIRSLFSAYPASKIEHDPVSV